MAPARDMTRAAWLNAGLAAAVAALAAWVYLKPPAPGPALHALSALDAATVRAVRIERADAPPLVLERRARDWRLLSPLAARADALRIARLLEILAAKTAHRLPATDLGRFELDRPQARLVVDGQEFRFGLVNEVTREQYVLTGGAVYAVSPRYGGALPAQAADLVSPRLLAPAEAPARIELKAFTVEQRDGRWQQTPPAKEAGQDDFLRWVEQWTLATAARVEPHAAGDPVETVRIALKDGSALALGVLQREPTLALLRPDEKLVYYFRGEAARLLLSPPGAPARPLPAPPGDAREP